VARRYACGTGSEGAARRDHFEARGSHLRELEVATLSVVAEMVWRRHPGGQWRWDLHGKATGEGQDQCDEEILEENKGEWVACRCH
jgi:hypothetical protein